VPPENVELGEEEVNTHWIHQKSTSGRTGFHTPQRATPLAPSSRTNAPVGTHKRLDPTNPGSCNAVNTVEDVAAQLKGRTRYPIAEM